MLRARYKRSIASGVLSLGLILFFGNILWFCFMKAGFVNFMLLLFGFVFTVFGIMMFTRPVFDLYNTSFIIYDLLGRERHKVYITDMSHIKLKGNKIFVDINGIEKFAPINRKLVDDHDWNMFLRRITHDFTSEIHEL